MIGRILLVIWLFALSALTFIFGMAAARARLRENCSIDDQARYFCTDYPGLYRGLFLVMTLALLVTIVLIRKNLNKASDAFEDVQHD